MLFGKEWSSQMSRQETEGHLRTHPKLLKLELRVAIHDAWELGQAVSKPSSLKEVPACLQRACLAVFTFSPWPSKAKASGTLRQRAEKQQELPSPGVQQAAQLGLDKTKPFVTYQKGTVRLLLGGQK